MSHIPRLVFLLKYFTSSRYWRVTVKWVIRDQNTLKEVESGFVIKLVEGTWFHPRDIYPITPPGMSPIAQVRLIREGLLYVDSLSVVPELAG